MKKGDRLQIKASSLEAFGSCIQVSRINKKEGRKREKITLEEYVSELTSNGVSVEYICSSLILTVMDVSRKGTLTLEVDQDTLVAVEKPLIEMCFLLKPKEVGFGVVLLQGPRAVVMTQEEYVNQLPPPRITSSSIFDRGSKARFTIKATTKA